MRIECDCVLGKIYSPDTKETWGIPFYDWEEIMRRILSPSQYGKIIDEDFHGEVSKIRFDKTKKYIETQIKNEHSCYKQF